MKLTNPERRAFETTLRELETEIKAVEKQAQRLREMQTPLARALRQFNCTQAIARGAWLAIEDWEAYSADQTEDDEPEEEIKSEEHVEDATRKLAECSKNPLRIDDDDESMLPPPRPKKRWPAVSKVLPDVLRLKPDRVTAWMLLEDVNAALKVKGEKPLTLVGMNRMLHKGAKKQPDWLVVINRANPSLKESRPSIFRNKLSKYHKEHMAKGRPALWEVFVMYYGMFVGRKFCQREVADKLSDIVHSKFQEARESKTDGYIKAVERDLERNRGWITRLEEKDHPPKSSRGAYHRARVWYVISNEGFKMLAAAHQRLLHLQR